MNSNWPRIILILFLGFMFLNIFYYLNPNTTINISYSQFRKYVEESKVKSITVEGDEISGIFKEKQKVNNSKVKNSKDEPEYKYFNTVLPSFGDTKLLQ